MSLKDKTFQTPVPRWDSTEEKPTWIEKDVVLLSDAEEEINQKEIEFQAVRHNYDESQKEIQTLVELLDVSLTLVHSYKRLIQQFDGPEELLTIANGHINKITQTLKKYEK